MKKYKLHLGTYDFEYYLVVGTDYDKIKKFVRSNMEDPDFDYNFEDARGAFFSRFNYYPVIWIKRKPKTPTEYGILSHEALHLVNYVMLKWTSIELRRECEEAYTHLLSKIVRDILTKLK